MKNLFSLLLGGALLINLLGCTKACQKTGSQKNTVLHIGTNANFPPFETIDEKGALVGFDIDLGRALAKEMGLVPQFKELDFDALVLALKKHKIDIIISGLSITKSRQAEIDMLPYQGKPITEIALLFWDKIPNDIKTLEELKDYATKNKLTISVQTGHFLEGFLREEGVPLKPLPGPPEQIMDIKYKKSLAAALDGINAKKLAQKHANLAIVLISLPEDKWDLGYGIGIDKSNHELREKVQKALQQLKDKGFIAELEKKWLEVEL